jgi:hypothetical protein
MMNWVSILIVGGSLLARIVGPQRKRGVDAHPLLTLRANKVQLTNSDSQSSWIGCRFMQM